MPVEYEVTVEPEQEGYRGMVSAIDDETDRETEQWITDQLNSGNELAWCFVTVRAKLDGFVGWDSLGGISCKNQADLDSLIADHDMHGQALADLRANIASVAKDSVKKARIEARMAKLALAKLDKEGA